MYFSQWGYALSKLCEGQYAKSSGPALCTGVLQYFYAPHEFKWMEQEECLSGFRDLTKHIILMIGRTQRCSGAQCLTVVIIKM